ncbi:MAG: dipeptidase [Candidatus Krumholzibacteriota bacterium]|nr:dipeptidase [Candidatus Krumholzibacteriota bacterium]
MNKAGAGFVFDAHCDTATRLTDDDGIDLGKRLPDGHIDLPRMREAGYGAQVFACWVDPDLPPERWNASTIEMIGRLRRQIEKNSGSARVVNKGSEIRSITDDRKIAVVIGVEGGHAVGSDVEALHRLYENGVRCLTLTWNNNNEIADSCEGEDRWGGLSEFGFEVVKEMDRAGMVIDLSHSSDRTFFDLIEAASNPILVSHSCMRAICDVPRNITDDMLRALSENGGVVGINYFPAFLEQVCSDQVMSVWNRYKKERSELAEKYDGDVARVDGEILDRYMKQISVIPMPGIAEVADHIEHAVSVAGISHVGLGSDFDGTPIMPVGLEDISGVPLIAAELKNRGFSDEDTDRVMGANLLRLFEKVCA